jgi:hypothetical protein
VVIEFVLYAGKTNDSCPLIEIAVCSHINGAVFISPSIPNLTVTAASSHLVIFPCK